MQRLKVLVILGVLMAIIGHSVAFSAIVEHSDSQIADAIYQAEGGSKTNHPYGILKHYKHTTPRQACINTIRHQRKEWFKSGSKGDFIQFLGGVYCPVLGDTTGLNKNWVKNVTCLLKKNEKR